MGRHKSKKHPSEDVRKRTEAEALAGGAQGEKPSFSTEDVAISLSLGTLHGKRLRRFAKKFMFPFASLFPLLTLAMLISPFEWTAISIFSMIGCNLLGLSCFVVLPLCLILKDRRKRNKVRLWLEDAVELPARTKSFGIKYRTFFELPRGLRFEVRFKFESRKYVRSFTARKLGAEDCYEAGLEEYADREVRILYSPRYDEVMILKPPSSEVNKTPEQA